MGTAREEAEREGVGGKRRSNATTVLEGPATKEPGGERFELWLESGLAVGVGVPAWDEVVAFDFDAKGDSTREELEEGSKGTICEGNE